MRKPRCPSSRELTSVGSEAQKTNKVSKQQAKITDNFTGSCS